MISRAVRWNTRSSNSTQEQEKLSDCSKLSRNETDSPDKHQGNNVAHTTKEEEQEQLSDSSTNSPQNETSSPHLGIFYATTGDNDSEEEYHFDCTQSDFPESPLRPYFS